MTTPSPSSSLRRTVWPRPSGLAFHGNQWPLGFERFGFYAPKHYLEQFHPTYNADATYEQFEEKAMDYNVERPVMTAWKITQYEAGATLMVAERNPYYWAVDEEGNQLPYIDQIYFHLVEDVAGVNVMGIAGEIDMQDRAIDSGPVPGLHGKRRSERLSHAAVAAGSWPPTRPSSSTRASAI